MIARLGEPVQTDPELLARFAATGVVPGARVVVGHGRAASSTLGVPGFELVLDLPEEVARHVFVHES